MRSKSSFFNKTLFFKNCSRFWPLWVAYTVIWLLILPGQLFVNMVDDPYHTEGLLRFAQREVLSCTGDAAILLAAGFGLLCALAVFSYLFFPRAAGLMHTLPIRREGLFVTNYLSGLCFMWVPNLLTAVLLLAVEASAGVLVAGNVFIWLAVTCGTTFFFYTFAVLCAMLTGNVLAMPALYVIFNCVVFVLYSLINALIGMFSYGYVDSDAFNDFALWCTPVGKLVDKVGVEYLRDAEHNIIDYQFMGGDVVAIYAVVGVLFLVFALLLYRRRHIESAGDVIAVGWAKPIFKYGFAFCAALCGSWVLYYVFFRVLLPTDFLGLLIPLLLCGFLGCFVAEMLLQKSFKVFRKGWISSLVFTAVLAAGLFGLSVDALGFETQIPDLEDIDEVYFELTSTPPYDEANGLYDRFGTDEMERLEAIHLIHHTIIQNRGQYENFDYSDMPAEGQFNTICFTYTLKDGSALQRRYQVPILHGSDTAPATSLEGRLLALLRDPELMMECYFGNTEYLRAGGARLDVFNPNTRKMDILYIEDQAQLDALYEAVVADMEAGRLGIRYLSDFDPARQNNCAVNDLRLDMLYTATDSVTGKEFLESRNINITIQFTATETLRVLAEIGAFTELQTLISQAQSDNDSGYYTPEYWEKYDMPFAVTEEFTGEIIYPETTATTAVITGVSVD